MTIIIKPDNKTSNTTEIGKRYLFWQPGRPDDETFLLSSTLENIGIIDKHDVQLKNKTIVLVLGEPIIADHLFMGRISVIRVMAHQAVWIATHTLWPIEGE